MASPLIVSVGLNFINLLVFGRKMFESSENVRNRSQSPSNDLENFRATVRTKVAKIVNNVCYGYKQEMNKLNEPLTLPNSGKL